MSSLMLCDDVTREGQTRSQFSSTGFSEKRGVSMWNNKTKKTMIVLVCSLVIGIVFFGSVMTYGVEAATASPSHSHSASSTGLATTNAATFTVTSISMSVSPTSVSLWKCGSYIQVVYNAVFHVNWPKRGNNCVLLHRE